MDKAIPVTGGGEPWKCETSRNLNFEENSLRDGDEVVSFTRRPRFNHRKIPGTNFYSRLSETQGHIATGKSS
jgi:hypothetical protein